ncbi:MAG TPA: protoporphyrinogen oxidase [Terriglobales bacterium]|nr:protoporphyrinogen oxidase [Terriglobales bacterium]
MKTIAIVGGGIAGLSAAFALEKHRRKHPESLEYSVYECNPIFGGVLHTEQVDGCQIEAGPDSFLTEKPWAAELCRELGLEDQLVGSNDRERKTYILVNGKLIEIPDGLMFMVPTKLLPTVLSPLFGMKTKIRMAREWFHPPHRAEADETVSAFVERHYGSEMVDRLADPLLSGVYGGHADQLSVRAVLPRFAEMEAKYGSLGRAMLAARRKMRRLKGTPQPLFTSLLGGMQLMTDALVARISTVSLAPSQRVLSVVPQGAGWQITLEQGLRNFDSIVLAVPAHVSAALLHRANPQLANELKGIHYTSSITINLGYPENVRKSLPPGFGYLVPRSQGRNMLACTFVHTKFPHRVPADRALLRCFMAASNQQELLSDTEESIVSVIRHELREILGLNAQPLFSRVYRWEGAMAQYGVGHLERLQKIEQSRKTTPGLFLAGNGYRGIGVPDCIRSGNEAAALALNFLGITAAAVRTPQLA